MRDWYFDTLHGASIFIWIEAVRKLAESLVLASEGDMGRAALRLGVGVVAIFFAIAVWKRA